MVGGQPAQIFTKQNSTDSGRADGGLSRRDVTSLGQLPDFSCWPGPPANQLPILGAHSRQGASSAGIAEGAVPEAGIPEGDQGALPAECCRRWSSLGLFLAALGQIPAAT